MKITYKIIIMLFILCNTSCKENNKMFFDESISTMNIWLGSKDYPVDSVTYNFIHMQYYDSLTFYARIIGLPVDYDRSFSLKAVEGDIEKVNYTTGDYVIKSGEYEGVFQIYFQSSSDYNNFKDEDGYIIFKMEENQYFESGTEEYNHLHIVFKNYVAKPDDWDNAEYPYLKLSQYFGTYSNVKYEFIIKTTGYSNFRVAQNLIEGEDNVITTQMASYLASKCKIALEEENAEREAQNLGPLTDEYGEPISF